MGKVAYASEASASLEVLLSITIIFSNPEAGFFCSVVIKTELPIDLFSPNDSHFDYLIASNPATVGCWFGCGHSPTPVEIPSS